MPLGPAWPSAFHQYSYSRATLQGQVPVRILKARSVKRSSAMTAAGPGVGWWLGRGPGCLGQQVPERGPDGTVAVGLSGSASVHRTHRWPAPAPASPRIGGSASGRGGGPAQRDQQARDVPHLPAFLRDPFARGWLRYSDGAGAIGAPGRIDDDAVYPCLEPGATGGSEPIGPGGAGGPDEGLAI